MTHNRSQCTLGPDRCPTHTVVGRIHCVARHSEKPATKLAENIGVGYDWFTKITPDSGRANAPAWLMLALAIHTGRTEHIETLAHEAGLICYQLPKGKTTTDHQTADVLREFGEWLTELSASVSDGAIDDDEIARVRAQWREVVNVGSALVDGLTATSERRVRHLDERRAVTR